MVATEERSTVSRLLVAQSQAVRKVSSSKKCVLGSIHSWTRLEKTYAVSLGVFSGESGSGVIHRLAGSSSGQGT